MRTIWNPSKALAVGTTAGALAIAGLLGALPSAWAQSASALKRISRSPNPMIFSAGYLLGQAVNPTAEGPEVESFKTRIFLGIDSVAADITDGRCVYDRLLAAHELNPQLDLENIRQAVEQECTEPLNPFVLSSYNTNWKARFESGQATKPTLFHFKGFVLHPYLDSAYLVDEIIPVNPLSPVRSLSLDESAKLIDYRRVEYDLSHYDGRVVLASEDGVIGRHFHAAMQIGPSGGRFVRLDVPTRSLFDDIVDMMATGRKVRAYVQVFHGQEPLPSGLERDYETNLRVYRVDLLE
jgi:hypothetical protein